MKKENKSFLFLLVLSLFPIFVTPTNHETTDISSIITFYGARDNCPPGGDIAYPIIHQQAGGTGNFSDPITFAGDSKAFQPGTKLYVKFLKKYFLMEDECEECEKDWKKKKYHIDLWIGPDELVNGSLLIGCEVALTPDGNSEVIVNPSDDLEVDYTPLFADGHCIVPATPCDDPSTECGNSCEIPKAATCRELAKMFILTYDRFIALNPDLDCKKEVPEGTSVCM